LINLSLRFNHNAELVVKHDLLAFRLGERHLGKGVL